MPNAQNTKTNPNAQHIQKKKEKKNKNTYESVRKGQLLNQAIKSFSIDLGGKVVSKEN